MILVLRYFKGDEMGFEEYVKSTYLFIFQKWDMFFVWSNLLTSSDINWEIHVKSNSNLLFCETNFLKLLGNFFFKFSSI